MRKNLYEKSDLEWAKKSEGPHREPPEISINPKSQLLIFFPL